jgi:hypothetical protein
VTSVDAVSYVRLQIPATDRRGAGTEDAYAELAERLIPKALDLVMRVRDEGRESIGAFLRSLSDLERHALPVVLAAMVPPDRTEADLLGWVPRPNTPHASTPQPARPASAGTKTLRPCGTHAAFVRHKNNGEPIDELCEQAERDYQREYKRNSRKRRATKVG